MAAERPARVLHMPVNLASVVSGNVEGLRELGLEAHGFVIGSSPLVDDAGLEVIDIPARAGTPRWFRKRAIITSRFLANLRWADVVHWYFDGHVLPGSLDLSIVSAMKKPAVVQWLGSELRNPDLEAADNHWYAEVFGAGYEYREYESAERSLRVQREFASRGFWFAPNRGMAQYVAPEFCDHMTPVDRPVKVELYQPSYPDPQRKRPLVVHAPSAPIGKGTAHVLRAVEQLRERFEFDFRLLQDMQHDETMRVLSSADIVLDQFIVGDFGVLALEGMAFGKPVIGYIKPSIAKVYPSDLPIVSADADTLAQTLGRLLADGEERSRLGRLGRAYVEREHAPAAIARMLLEAYRNAYRLRGVEAPF